jgi:hypothetical protein
VIVNRLYRMLNMEECGGNMRKEDEPQIRERGTNI